MPSSSSAATTPKKGGNRPKSAPMEEEYTGKPPTAEQLDKAFRATRSMPPSWSMAGKPAMIPGDAVPSWVASIPGPKYHVETDKFKKRAPSWAISPVKKDMKKSASAPASPRKEDGAVGLDPSMVEKGLRATTPQPPQWSLGLKPEMIIGGTVPSWTKSIPGPKYLYDTNKFKGRQPVYTIGKKLDMVIGGNIPSWTNSIPGPIYKYDTDKFKTKRPVYTIGEKLPTEGEIMSKRSPGPVYGGPVTDAAKQAEVDGSKRRTCAPSFGVGSRFEGRAAHLVRTGATGRYEHGRYAFG